MCLAPEPSCIASITWRDSPSPLLGNSPTLTLTMALASSSRMACDSTWLLDQQTDHSVKPDELITVLEELDRFAEAMEDVIRNGLPEA